MPVDKRWHLSWIRDKIWRERIPHCLKLNCEGTKKLNLKEITNYVPYTADVLVLLLAIANEVWRNCGHVVKYSTGFGSLRRSSYDKYWRRKSYLSKRRGKNWYLIITVWLKRKDMRAPHVHKFWQDDNTLYNLPTNCWWGVGGGRGKGKHRWRMRLARCFSRCTELQR